MLVNGRALLSLINSKSYDRRLSEKLRLLQDERWREVYAILTANLLFIFEDEHHLASPIVMIIIEDCTVEPADDNQTGMPFSFVLKSKTTKRVFTFSAETFKSLEQWIHYLTVCSLEYIQAMLSNSSDQVKTDEKADQSNSSDKTEQPTPAPETEQLNSDTTEDRPAPETAQPKTDGKASQIKSKNKTKAKNRASASAGSNHKT